jgi:hypothetical protein
MVKSTSFSRAKFTQLMTSATSGRLTYLGSPRVDRPALITLLRSTLVSQAHVTGGCVLCHDQDCCCLWPILINLRLGDVERGTPMYYNGVLDRHPSSHRRSRVEDGIYL